MRNQFFQIRKMRMKRLLLLLQEIMRPLQFLSDEMLKTSEIRRIDACTRLLC